ncbi:DEAD/DEAH box helicase family protein [[Eubacterium] cellulosolvens]
MFVKISYERGTLIIKGDVQVPNVSWDSRIGAYRAMALDYKDIIKYLNQSKIPYVDEVLNPIPCPYLHCKVKMRGYQEEALNAWMKAERRGVIVLPTGSGKTVIAVGAISKLNIATLIIVPTLDLVEQWRRALLKEFDVEVGMYGGGENILKALTVSTYDSAYLKAEELGHRFELIIFDEVHHLPSTGFRHIAEMFASPYRMGLTATYERDDGLHLELPRLVGGKVYELAVQDLAGKHLSEYDLERIYVDLTPDEKAEYDCNHKVFADYLASRKIILRSPRDFTYFIMRTGRDPAAREALLARNKAINIALNSQSKLDALKRVLMENPHDSTIIFTQHNKLVHRIAREFFIPCITYLTPKDERTEILDSFRDRKYRLIVTSKVLDEGVDVPDANRAIILSGTGSSREFIQRLGRVLRKREGKRAKLVEIISRETTETHMSWRRKRKWREDAPTQSYDR